MGSLLFFYVLTPKGVFCCFRLCGLQSACKTRNHSVILVILSVSE